MAWRIVLKPGQGCRTLQHRALRGTMVVLLIQFAIAGPPGTRPAMAAPSEGHLLSITKMTVYGALLGGLLGLASALVVRESYRDDAIRWGVAAGAFGGFAYGLASKPEEGGDDLSLSSRGYGGVREGRSEPSPSCEQLMGLAHPWERSPAVRASGASRACCLSGETGPPGERPSRELVLGALRNRRVAGHAGLEEEKGCGPQDEEGCAP